MDCRIGQGFGGMRFRGRSQRSEPCPGEDLRLPRPQYCVCFPAQGVGKAQKPSPCPFGRTLLGQGCPGIAAIIRAIAQGKQTLRFRMKHDGGSKHDGNEAQPCFREPYLVGILEHGQLAHRKSVAHMVFQQEKGTDGLFGESRLPRIGLRARHDGKGDGVRAHIAWFWGEEPGRRT